MPTYAVKTYDPETGGYTPDDLDGRLTVGLTLAGVLRVCRWLRESGYVVTRKRLPNGDREQAEPSVLVERDEDMPETAYRRVADELPPLDDLVCLYDERRDCGWLGARVYSPDADGWLWARVYDAPDYQDGYWAADNVDEDDAAPTHWAPLPKPPRKREGK